MSLRFVACIGVVLAAVVFACTDDSGATPDLSVQVDAGGVDAAGVDTGSSVTDATTKEDASEASTSDAQQLGDAADAGTDASPDDFTMGAVTLTEQVSTSNTDGLDPEITLQHRRTEYPPYAALNVGSSWSDPTGFVYDTLLFIYGDGGPTVSGTYAFGGSAYDHVTMTTSKRGDGGYEYQCHAAAGTLTIADDGPGKEATGAFTVTSWGGSGACPVTPTTGSFHILHDADDLTGNPGTQGDSFTVDSVKYTEGGDALYAPFVYARHNGANKTLIVTMRAGVSALPDAGSESDERHIELYVYGNGSTTGGSYPIGSGALVTYQSGNVTCLAPVDGDGSIAVSAYGGVGSVINGTITINQWNSGTGCPATPWTVPFVATREADRP